MPINKTIHREQGRVSAGPLVFALVMAVFWITLGSAVIPAARSHDFLNLYTGASLAREGHFADLHDRDLQLQRERALVPETPALIPFVRPHFYAALLAPLALLSYDTALGAWLVLHVLLLIACWAWGYRTFGSDALIFGSLYLPTAMGIAHGQDGVLMLCIVIGAYRFAQSQQPFGSGALLALGLIKFHLLLLAPVAMVITRQWRMLQGFCMTGVSVALISVLLGGVKGAYGYVDLLLSNDIERLSPSPELMINVHSIPINLGSDYVLLPAALVAAVIVLMVLAIRNAPLWRFFAGWTAASLLMAPHVFGYDAALLLLPLWLAIFYSKSSPVRFSAVFLVTPIPFAGSLMGSPWALIPSLSLLVLLASLAIEGHRERSGGPARLVSFGPPGRSDSSDQASSAFLH